MSSLLGFLMGGPNVLLGGFLLIRLLFLNISLAIGMLGNRRTTPDSALVVFSVEMSKGESEQGEH